MKKILVVSDIHSGSIYSVMPDEVWIESRDHSRSNRIEANPIQSILYERWQEMCDWGRFDRCFILGDSIDGPNIKSRGFELWTPNLHQQTATATDLISMPKVPRRQYFGVQGSFYHVGENTSSDLAVIDQKRGQFGTDLVVEIDSTRIHICHEIAWSGSPVSKATAPMGELVAAAMNDKYLGQFDLLIRGHRHEYLDLKSRLGHILCMPAWKARDSFGAKKGMKSAVSDIGFAVLEIAGSSIEIEEVVWTPKEEHIFRTVVA